MIIAATGDLLMGSTGDGSGTKRKQDRIAPKEEQDDSSHLEIARRIVRETLEAERRALEMEATFGSAELCVTSNWIA
jgi:hypothetical protein